MGNAGGLVAGICCLMEDEWSRIFGWITGTSSGLKELNNTL